MGQLIRWDDDRHFALPTQDPDTFVAITGRITEVATATGDDGTTEVVIRVAVRRSVVRPNRVVGSEDGSDADRG